jgi:hypothetical protein
MVLPRREADIPIDPSITVSIGSLVEAIHQTLFECGTDLFFCTGEQDIENATGSINIPLQEQDPVGMMKDNCIFLEASKTQLNLTPGQKLVVEIHDWFRLLNGRRRNTVWMIQLTEELQWRAHGRKALNQQTWNLYANHHELPRTLTPTYDHDTQSLFQIRHEMIIYMTTTTPNKNFAKEVLASTAPIPVKIVSSRAGWDA